MTLKQQSVRIVIFCEKKKSFYSKDGKLLSVKKINKI